MKKENLCVFYASKFHLSLILLEYFKNKKKAEKYNVITFLQNNIEDEINLIRNRYNFNLNNKIDFKETKCIENKEINNINKRIIFIIVGDEEYIINANYYVKENLDTFRDIIIINCFDFDMQRNYMMNILKKNDKILYTTGEEKIYIDS